MDANVSPDVHEFDLLAYARPQEVNDVEIFKVTTDVICKINTVAWVAAGCSPVSGVGLEGPHSLQTQAVHIPVMGVLVDWSVIHKRSCFELRKPSKDVSPRHHQGPCCTRLGLEVTVGWKTFTMVVIKLVNAACGLVCGVIIKAGLGAEWMLINIRHRLGTAISQNFLPCTPLNVRDDHL